MADLAQRRGVDPAEITVVIQEEVTWRDGSLGCPQPGMRYTQALVNGYRIVLEYEGTTYRYHGAGGRTPFLCEQAKTSQDADREARRRRTLRPKPE